MPRPHKYRQVEAEPPCSCFFPEEDELVRKEHIVLSVDEYEAVRLIDYQKLDQADCARLMGIARTTAQNIYNSARFKLAQMLVHGQPLEISGGRYEISGERFTGGCCMNGFETIERIGGIAGVYSGICSNDGKGIKQMKIAVTYDNETGEIFQHFGRTEFFKVYEVEDKKVVKSEVVSTNGEGHGALAGVLSSLQADVLICGGIGGGAQMALASAGVKLFGGCAGSADQAVEAFLSDTLAFQEDVHCDHHDHEEGGCGHEGGCCH